MSELEFLNFNFGKKTMLMIKVSLTCSILTLICALLCFYVLKIDGVIFYALLLYSVVNFLNIVVFLKHRNLEVAYNIMSVLAFLVTYITCLFSDGINSPFSSFLVLLIFSGYATNRFYGDLWLVIISVAVLSLFVINISSYQFSNDVTTEVKDYFNFFFLMFLIILLGGVFGRLMCKNNDLVYKSKKEIARQNEEKTVMLKEIHHRVKNNLQVVNSLLRMQSRGIDDDNVKLMFKLTQNRVVAMARLHEKIYNTKDLIYIDVIDHFKSLVRDLIHSYNLEHKITSSCKISPVKLSIDTLLPLSLIINELVSDSLKNKTNGAKIKEIIVRLKALEANRYELIVGDSSEAISPSLVSELTNRTGARLIKTFVKQLHGEIEYVKDNAQAHYRIVFSSI
ncbi:MAG: sensor histidine kinase [Flavobacteriaceae bacterium]